MNYYQELGIPNTASPEEVRQAYRNLARLLHPDQQSDETLRRLAGIQMTRLNGILETLTEPGLRASYDNSLRMANESPARGERMRAHGTVAGDLYVPIQERRWSRYAWPGAGVVGIGLIVLFLGQDVAVQRPIGDGEGNVLAGEQSESGAGAWPVRTEGQIPVWNRKAEPDQPPFPANNNDKRVMGGHAGFGPMNRPEAGGFGGEWYYAAPAKLAGPEGMCPPMYVDVEISESRGEVEGKYSARYQVGERAISPFVEFEFTGSAREPAANLKWSGSGGAAGSVRLTLLSARSMRVEWSADSLGQQMGLASGMATLVRRGSP